MGTDGQENTGTPPATIFFSRTYDEALALVHEARSYLAGPGQEKVKDLSTGSSFEYATQSLRLTTRLTETMSWLMFQRALQAGEITAEEAQAEDCHIQYFDVCLPDEGDAAAVDLPEGLISLLERSESLYRRIARLDQRGIDAWQKYHS
ncbi:MAG: hypothetical protein COB93_00870 [Sneathiella sp.]|nr:MAG: hypothetical protein COB93_00870 [Sneathiella sp.]